jgi:hypothetical protein
LIFDRFSAVGDYGVTLDALALRLSGFCSAMVNTRISPGA